MVKIPIRILLLLFSPKYFISVLKGDKSSVGSVYYINPKHLVPPDEMIEYSKSKKGQVNNRPVMVAIERKNNTVQLSRMTSKATPKQIALNQKVRLKHTYPGDKKYIDTNTISKSKASGKKFKIGEDPLLKSKSKVNQKDINNYNLARKKRGR